MDVSALCNSALQAKEIANTSADTAYDRQTNFLSLAEDESIAYLVHGEGELSCDLEVLAILSKLMEHETALGAAGHWAYRADHRAAVANALRSELLAFEARHLAPRLGEMPTEAGDG